MILVRGGTGREGQCRAGWQFMNGHSGGTVVNLFSVPQKRGVERVTGKG